MNQSLGLVSAALAPAVIFLGGVVYPRLPRWGSLCAAASAGALSAYLALGAETLLTAHPWSISNLGGLAFFTLAAVGLIEEGAKLLVLRTLLWRLPSFQEAYDGIILGTAVGLGFGATENISYVLDAGYDVALARAFTAVPLHGMLGVILGYYLGQAKVWELSRGKNSTPLILGGLGLVALVHGIYDFLALQSSPVALGLFWGSLLLLVAWSWRLIGRSRSWSPTWGGSGFPFEAPFYIAPQITPRSPWLAGLLGLIPGLGQWYNREGQKGICLALAGLVNLLIFSGLWWLLQDPQSALLTLLSWGLLLGPNPVGLIQTLQQSPVLPLMGTLMVSLSLLGAVDAYWVARTNRFDYLQAPSLRVSWVQSVALAYGGHLLALLLLVLVPILGGGGSGHAHQPPTPGSEPLIFDLVSEPTTLTGHAQAPAGKPQGQDSRNRTAQPLTQPSHGLTGNRVKPRPATPSQTAKGIAHSYNDYISGELRREQERYDQYFAHLLPGEYTVLRYHVGTDGEIYDIEILPDHTTAPPNVSQLAMEQIQHLSPLLPPPSQGRELIVTELFWQFDQVGPAGSLEEKLSQLPDGRMIEVAD